MYQVCSCAKDAKDIHCPIHGIPKPCEFTVYPPLQDNVPIEEQVVWVKN